MWAAGYNVLASRSRSWPIERADRGLRQALVYDAEAARRVRFVKRAQKLGFALSEVEEFLLSEGIVVSPGPWRRRRDPRPLSG